MHVSDIIYSGNAFSILIKIYGFILQVRELIKILTFYYVFNS